MRFGLSLPHYGFSLPGEPTTFGAMASWARKAEAVGFDSVWVSDHFFYSFARYGGNPEPIASLEPLTSLAGLASVTQRVRLGVLVLGAPFRHPATVAKMAATIDQVSGGRLDLGLGAGWLEQEFDAFGYRFASTAERFRALEDALVILEGLLSAGHERPISHEGHVWSVRDARLLPSPVQRPVPTWVGGKGGPRLLRLAARHAAGWNTVWRFTDAWYRERVQVARALCEDEGRDPSTFRLSVGFHALIGEDEADARAIFERGRAAMPGGAMDRDTYEDWCVETLSGTPGQVVERVMALETLGVEEIVVAPWVLPFAVPEPEIVERFADRVIAPLRATR